ncbi:Cardiolipin synthase B [Candidatus Bilamarchaeum dharawalense]|uniref:Cardiolipin synthase B n=1 Tax=Candidatus Bilamarchaeum dharawalense TaxID=2885759 RepID=A0A5E4LM46_9ARCH|nr:Cardiolipin synthase B [Candidatus Bilamarchaeum dharawalense]
MKWGMFGLGLVVGFLFCFILLNFIVTPQINIIFSPEDGHEIIDLIDSAQESIDIEMYVFTSRDAIEALERAKNRGVDIRIIIERNVISGQNAEAYNELNAKGIQTRYASRVYELTHSKIIIIDGKKVLVGSHNLSNSALYKNREASVVLIDVPSVKIFIENYEKDWILAS